MEFEERKHGFRLSEVLFSVLGKKAEINSEMIHGKPVNIIFTFFNESSYRADFNDWFDFQNRVYKTIERGQKVEGFKIYDAVKKKKYIEYREFKRVIVPFMSRIFFQVFHDNPDLLADRESIILQIKVGRMERWEHDWAANHHSFTGAFPYSEPGYFLTKALQGDLLDLDHYYIVFSGFYLLQSIVAPYLFLNRIDYQFLYKYLAHEIDHYHSYAKGYYTPEFALADRTKQQMSVKSDYSLDFLFTCLSDLRNEGLADFRKKRYAPRILVVPQIIRSFKNLIKRIPEIKKKRELEEYYEKEIYAGSMEGVYHCGYVMCFFIAYAFDRELWKEPLKERLKRKAGMRGNVPEIIFKGGFRTDLSKLQHVFNSETEFFISAPSEEAYKKVLAVIGNSDPAGFLREYEAACDVLGLDSNSRVLTTKFFKGLWEKAEYIFGREELRKIKRQGYYPVF